MNRSAILVCVLAGSLAFSGVCRAGAGCGSAGCSAGAATPAAGKAAANQASRGMHGRRGHSQLMSAAMMVQHLMASGKADQAKQIAKKIAEHTLPLKADSKLQPGDYDALHKIFTTAEDKASAAVVLKGWLNAVVSSDAMRKQMSSRQWLSLGQTLKQAGKASDVSKIAALARQQLTQQIQAKQPMTVLYLADLEQLADVAGDATLKQQAAAAMEASVMKDGQYIKEVAPIELARLGQVYRMRKDKQSLNRLAAFIANDYVTELGLADALRGHDWTGLIEVVNDSGNKQARRQLCQFVTLRIRTDRINLDKTPRSYLHKLQESLADLGVDKADRQQLIGQWLGMSYAWKELDAEVRDGFAGSLSSSARTATPEWCKRAMERLASDATVGNLEFAVLLLPRSVRQLSDEQAGVLVKALVKLEDRSACISDETYKRLASLLKKHGLLLRENLTDASGQLSLCVAKVLATNLGERGYTHRFLKELNTKMQGSSGDAQARWELGKAYTLSMHRGARSERITGQELINKAMACSASEVMRVHCLEELAAAGIAAGQPDMPIHAMESVWGSLSPAQQKRLDVWMARLENLSLTTAGQAKAAKDWRWRFSKRFSRPVKPAGGSNG